MWEKRENWGILIMFQGATSLNLDAKGRLIVPIKHRTELQSTAQGGVILTAHPHRCLLLYPVDAWGPIRANIMGFSSFDKTASAYKRILVGFAEELELDNAGRLLISRALRQFAHFEKQVMLIGQGSHFEIWSNVFWEKQLENLELEGDVMPTDFKDFAL